MNILINISGWTGTALIVLAYFLVSNKKLDPAGKVYQHMNLWGSLGVGIHVFHQRAWPAVTLEIVWAIIAIWALVKANNLASTK